MQYLPLTLRTIAVASVCQVILSAAPQQVMSSRALLDRYCIGCHNQKAKIAGLMLDKADLDSIPAGAEVWEKVVRKLRGGLMPPPGLPRPEPAAIDAFSFWLETSLDRAAAEKPNPGRAPVHRLNQAEYTNAVRDLLGLDIDGRQFLPSDNADQQGFDNIAGTLTVSPALLERYLSGARKIARLAVGEPKISAAFENYEIPKNLTQEGRMDEDLPFGSQGGIAIHHQFPVDGDYVLKIRLRRQVYDYILGMGRPHQLEVRLDGRRIKAFTVGGAAKGKPSPLRGWAGNILGDTEWEAYMHLADSGLEIRFPALAGKRLVGVSFVGETWEPEGILQPPTTGRGVSLDQQYDGAPAVESVAIGGPYDAKGPGQTASRDKIFVCRPARVADETACANKILTILARRAYRRAVTKEDVQTLREFYKAGRDRAGFEAGIESALERVLVDPEFLFRIEHDPPAASPGTIYRLSDFELASRMSFFLWSSLPDDELLDLASAGKLRNSAILEQQVRRMLTDCRSASLVDNFAFQWLNLSRIRGANPDPDLFPEFDENLREAFQEETRLFIANQMREDRSVTDLLNANYTFVNERLAKHYGLSDVYGERYRKVTIDPAERGGLLGQGSILLVTAYPNRTSPVLRGKWVLDNLLGMPPPPPPPDVPALKESGANGRPTSVRERMEQHRKNPACAVCHVRMDPLGFALENYDAVGKRRTMSDGTAIDSTGTLPDGTKFQGMAGLRKILLSHPEQFVGTFAEKLLTYALGRELEYYDQPAVRKITRDAAVTQYRWSDIISGIVASTPFQKGLVPANQLQAEQRRLRE